jgi:4-hydroxybenzoyl-CoA thioesterase
MAHVARVAVRFGDVDAAGIVYYPRFFHLLHVAFEDYFADHVGIPYHVLIREQGLGFPAVHVSCDFRAPLRMGEVLQVQIAAPRIGRSSVRFLHRVMVADPDDLRAEMTMDRVCVDMKTLRPVPIPEAIRARFLA